MGTGLDLQAQALENSGQPAVQQITPEDRMATQLREIRGEALATTGRWQKLSLLSRLVEAWHGSAPPECHGWYLATTAARIGLHLHEKHRQALADLAKWELVESEIVADLEKQLADKQREMEALTEAAEKDDLDDHAKISRLVEENAELRKINACFADRIAKQSDQLTKNAEADRSYKAVIEQAEAANAELRSRIGAMSEKLDRLAESARKDEEKLKADLGREVGFTNEIRHYNTQLHNKLVDIAREVERIRKQPLTPSIPK